MTVIFYMLIELKAHPGSPRGLCPPGGQLPGVGRFSIVGH